MQIVIDIPEEYYNILKTYGGMSVPEEAILNGIPLPKGHGRMVDVDKLIHSKCNECGNIKEVNCSIPCYAVRRMLDAPTIIKADKEIE